MLKTYKYWGSAYTPVYLKADSRLPEEVRDSIIITAAEMYCKKEKKKDIKGDTFEARVSTKRKQQLLGCYFGQKFQADIEIDDCRATISFLLMKYIYPENN